MLKLRRPRKVRAIDRIIWNVLPLMSIPAIIGAVGYAIGYERGKMKERKYYQPLVEAYSSDNEGLKDLNKTLLEERERFLDELLLQEQLRLQEQMRKFKFRKPDTCEL